MLRATQMLPQVAEGWIFLIRALRLSGHAASATPFITAGLPARPDHPGILIEAAETAFNLGDLDAVHQNCAKVRDAHPQIVEAYVTEMRLLRVRGLYEEAAALGTAAENAGVNHPSVDVERVMLALLQGAYSQADALATALRTQYRHFHEGYVLGATALRSLGQVEKALSLLEAGAEIIPNNINIIVERISLALNQEDASTALRLCEEASERFPGNQELARLASLARLRTEQDAEAAAEAAMLQFPDDPRFALEHAQRATERRDWSAAAARWDLVRQRFPDLPQSYVNGGDALLNLGRYDEAETWLGEGTARFPSDHNMARLFALSARRRQDWTTAVQRWQDAIARFPDAAEMQAGLGETRVAIDLARLDGHELSLRLADIGQIAGVTRAILTAAGVSEMPDRDFFLGFEGLGDNCAFGGFQRIFGAEPLGLLRWANVGPANLVDMLQTRFEGIGNPENTFLEINPDSNEYYGGDRRYFRMHTFVQAQDIAEDRMLSQMWRRLKFLREKLIDDLEAGEKIFVYTRSEGYLSDDEINSISAAMRQYGSLTLLCIRRAPHGDESKDGLVERWGEHLLVGTIAGLDPNPMHIHRVSAPLLEICRQARRLIPFTESSNT